jgi:hypothetical protein
MNIFEFCSSSTTSHCMGDELSIIDYNFNKNFISEIQNLYVTKQSIEKFINSLDNGLKNEKAFLVCDSLTALLKET